MAGKKRKRRRSNRNRNSHRALWVSLVSVFAVLLVAVSILLYLEFHRERLQDWLRSVSVSSLRTTPPSGNRRSDLETKRRSLLRSPRGGKAPESPGSSSGRIFHGSPKVAIIVDDIGQSLDPVRKLLSIDLPLTFSVLPGLENTERAVRMIHGHRREIMLHLPMEPIDYPRENPGKLALMIRMGPDEIRMRTEDLLREFPYLDGVNNHMGSRFTQDRERMDIVLREIRNRGFFFVDSLTSPESVALEEARRLGVRSGRRDIFLDHVDDRQSVDIQIDRLIELARERGYAIAIGHPRKNTIQVLKGSVQRFRSRGVQVVPVSRLITLLSREREERRNVMSRN